ncbi:MAG TPA: leucyl aminopeptidase [Candidatus Nanoarchaeia archaeon]|nr:leucyl aminopeptidase [Candidatus Nanoarchaeia archaeon]
MQKINPSVKLIKSDISSVSDKALVIGIFKEKLSLDSELKKLDSKLGNAISDYIRTNGFKAEKGDVKIIFSNKNVKNIVLVGLGELEKFDLSSLSGSIADTAKSLKYGGHETFSIFVDSFGNGKLKLSEIVEKITVSVIMALYQFNDFKTRDLEQIKYVRQVSLVTQSAESFEKELKYGTAVGEAANKTRDMVNTPPNIANPEYMAKYAKEIAKNNGLKCTVFDEKEIKKMKMECMMAVGEGSENRPNFVVLDYSGSKSKETYAIVGKGITFDSGGLNVKTHPHIINMKDDKSGAVAAIHIIEACAKLKLPINLVVAAPFAENMPSGHSYRPDDVLKAYNGITVEVKNTDAEGRMVLADALSYTASTYKPKFMVEMSTLTGASKIVLGSIAAPYLCNNPELTEKLETASEKSLEKIWELPLWPEFQESIRSPIADIQHISEDGGAGVIIGAAFLQNFVAETPWAHIDIGSTAWSNEEKGIITKGPTGATVRLLMEFLRNLK